MSANSKNNLNEWKSFGHARAKAFFSRQLLSESPAHAYLLLGNKGLGKESLAREFAEKILETNNLSSHPDFISIGVDDKLSVQNVRQLINKLSAKPFIAKKTVVIIDNADSLNLSGANALLKTLEEPTPSAVIILIAHKKMLPTIISRCLVVNFNPLSELEFAEACKILGYNFSEDLYVLSGGSIGKLIDFNKDKDKLNLISSHLRKLENFFVMQTSGKILLVQEYAELEAVDLREILLAWLAVIKKTLGRLPENYQLIAKILKAITRLDTNMNKKFILQDLFLA